MVEVIPHVNIQLNMLSYSPCRVDLSLPNRCCLNSELGKFWSLPNLSSPLGVSVCACVCEEEKGREGSKSNIRLLLQCTLFRSGGGGGGIGGGRGWRITHTGLILVITVDHIAATVNLNYAAVV